MRQVLTAAVAVLLFGACAENQPSPKAPAGACCERHLANVTRFTFDGDNRKAYFFRNGKRLVFQSNCDKIWNMNIDGSGKRMVSPGHVAHTCSFFLPDGRIVYVSTSALPGDCPPKPQAPPGARYVWLPYPYCISIADADGSHARKLTDNPKYDAEPVVSSDGKGWSGRRTGTLRSCTRRISSSRTGRNEQA